MPLQKYGRVKIWLAQALIASAVFASFVPSASAVTGTWKMGASIYPTDADDFASEAFFESLRKLRAAGANHVSLVIPYHQKNIESSRVFAGNDTPSDTTLISAIDFAHSIGLQVLLKPHLAPDDGKWRAYVDANNRGKWFESYGAMLNHLGDIGRQAGAEGICIGTELISMSTATANPENTRRWQKMIADLRTHFPGFITYNANWGGNDFMDEAEHIKFWSDLDYIGLSAYYPLASDKDNPNLWDIKGTWDYWNSTKIQPLHDKYNKPILFTEVGYRSVDGSHRDPWDGMREGMVNLGMQELLYEALFQYWDAKPYMAGIMMWDWTMNPDGGGYGDNQYTIQHKPAQNVLGRWFANRQAVAPYKPLEIASPVSGRAERGTTTLKARVAEEAGAEHMLYWQVNGGPLVRMSDSAASPGYKESVVDLGGWTWNKAGLYFINFVAKDGAGAIVSQKSTAITLP